MSKFDPRKLPKPDPGEAGLAAMRAALSLIVPGLGGVIGEGLTVILGPAVHRRRDKFVLDLERALHALQHQYEELSTEVLAQNESFVTAATHALLIAVRTHQQEKLDALRNAVLNAALP